MAAGVACPSSPVGRASQSRVAERGVVGVGHLTAAEPLALCKEKEVVNVEYSKEMRVVWLDPA